MDMTGIEGAVERLNEEVAIFKKRYSKEFSHQGVAHQHLWKRFKESPHRGIKTYLDAETPNLIRDGFKASDIEEFGNSFNC